MKLNALSPQALKPPYSAVSLPAKSNMSALLLGQERVTNAFMLLSAMENSAMYLVDFAGVERKWILEALVPESSNRHYLHGNITRTALNNALIQTGVLFICAESLLSHKNLWQTLLDCMLKKHVTIKGEAQRLQAKIVLVGSISVYQELNYIIPQFKTLFTLYGEVAFEINASESTLTAYLSWLVQIAALCHLSLTNDAAIELLIYSYSITEHNQRLSLSSRTIAQLLQEAAICQKEQTIDKKAIKQALQQQQQRHNLLEIEAAQNIDDKFIHIATTGNQVGQINGLTVVDTVNYSYGEPARITASAHYGDGEVIDIERKSELAGNIHAKGVMILSACLYRIFGRDTPIHLNANIIFEQSYQEIDGDSASVAEYCALISAITEQPIYQSLAVTGALDQFGNIQAIGGVNEKIESFFKLCARRGLTGEQGVIIPATNVQQLNLSDELITAVENKQFFIYEIDHIDQALYLLMGLEIGTIDDENRFPETSLYGLVQQRLDQLAGSEEDKPSFFSRIKAKCCFFER